MPLVRIVLVETSRLTSDLLTAVVDGEDDLAVVARMDSCDELLDRLDAVSPDIVIWGTAEPTLAQRALPVLRRRADLVVVGINAAGRDAAVCSLQPHMEPLEPLSAAALGPLLRRLGRWPA